MSWCSHVDSFADVNLDYLTSIHELETASSHDMLSFPGKCRPQQFLSSLIFAVILTCPQGLQLMQLQELCWHVSHQTRPRRQHDSADNASDGTSL